MIKISIDKIQGGVSLDEVKALKNDAEKANRMLHDGSGKGNDFLGWVNLPNEITPEQLAAIEACARSMASLSEVIVVIGIGGSYLGAKAVLEAMSDSFRLLHKTQDTPVVLFGTAYWGGLMDWLEGRRQTRCVADSGSTGGLRDFRDSGQCGRSLLGTDSGRTVAALCRGGQCRRAGTWSTRYGSGYGSGRAVRGESGCLVCCCAECALSERV